MCDRNVKFDFGEETTLLESLDSPGSRSRAAHGAEDNIFSSRSGGPNGRLSRLEETILETGAERLCNRAFTIKLDSSIRPQSFERSR